MLDDQLYQANDGLLPQRGGQAISGTTPIVMIIQGPINVNTSLTLFSTGTVTATWKIEASNDYAVSPGYGTNADSGHWGDITAAWRTPDATTGTAIANPAGSATSVYVEYMGNPGCGLGARSLKITLTPASGAGSIGVAVSSNRT